MNRYISYGIDLGTTNSCIAHFDGERVHVFQNNDQMNVTPSVVRIEKSGRIIVGRRAYATKMANPANVASEFKRWMGQKDRHTFKASGQQLSAEELSSEVLKALVEDVRTQTEEALNAAVITVPAAFGQLQCEATARAATLAGFKESILLQEPIAAAIAYGITSGSKDQRWLVFDLGGGTFDVAVMSSRDGRLTVMEHRGNNHLGGKDIDRLIVEKLLLPGLESAFNIPNKDQYPEAHQSLMQRLHLKAEEAKIDLTRNEKVIVGLFDLGEDQDGETIEGELEVTRRQLEKLCEPLIEKCILLCEEALAGARTSSSNLDRILLVGGPTQMPIIRKALEDRLKAKLDYSIDPMTIVAQGAAIHAAGIEKTPDRSPVETSSSTLSDEVKVILAFESVSANLQCPVEGRLDGAKVDKTTSVKIDAESGHWTSGWLTLDEGTFEALVSLLEGKNCKFWLYARDGQGKALKVAPDSFSIRHGLAMSAPPLPHTISTELVKPDGTTELEPMFKRGSPLPNEVTKTFRANKTLRPSEPAEIIAVKLWEGEALSDPEANEFVGNLVIESRSLQRPLAEGSEIEVTITIDTSRRMNVTAFVSKLNAHFTGVYSAQRDEEQFADLAAQVPEQVASHFNRLDAIEESIDADDKEALQQIEQLRKKLEDLDLDMDSQSGVSVAEDPDRAKRLVAESKNIRAGLGKLENKSGNFATNTAMLGEIEQLKRITADLVEACGTAIEKKEFSMLERELERALQKDDERGLRKGLESLNKLYARILFKQDWFWSETFKGLRSGSKNFTSQATAKQLISVGDEAVAKGDGEKLREVVQELWRLMPKEEVELDRDKTMMAGIRRQ